MRTIKQPSIMTVLPSEGPLHGSVTVDKLIFIVSSSHQNNSPKRIHVCFALQHDMRTMFQNPAHALHNTNLCMVFCRNDIHLNPTLCSPGTKSRALESSLGI